MKLTLNDLNGISPAICLHYHKEGLGNFLGGGSSLMLVTAVLVIWEI